MRRSASRHNSSITRYDSTVSVQLTRYKSEIRTGDHYLTPKQLEVLYRSNVTNGLTESMAKELLEKNGPNELKDLNGQSYWKLLRHNLFGWFQCVLWIGAILNFIVYLVDYIDAQKTGQEAKKENLYLGIVIVLTVLITGLFAFYQEAKNEKVMSGFLNMVPPNAIVIREGRKRMIPVTEVVVGDIVEMVGGDVVPADVRLLTCMNFTTNMSSLTGENKVIKHTIYFTSNNPLETKNMAYFTCPITEGTARGIVVATGENTELGRIAGLVTGLEKAKTPMAKEILYFIKIICVFAFIFGAVIGILVYIMHHNWFSAFYHMLGIVLANVPEGLLVSLTVCMTLSAKNLKKKQCLAKSLQAVETLGSTSCICTDKTGTLTENRMSVSHLFCGDKIISHDDFSHVGSQTYVDLCLAASICLKAYFIDGPDEMPINKRKINGDASESAILFYMEKHRSASITRSEYPIVCQIPFSSSYKYHVTIHQKPDDTYMLIMKGAPEVVLEYCTRKATEEGDQFLSVIEKRTLKKNFIKLGQKGERVLGYCDLNLSPANFPLGYQFDGQKLNFPLSELRFIGLISLIDPPRKMVAHSIAMCKRAGIRVMMVTGDHPVTALAISRKVGIISEENETAYDYAFNNNIDLSDVPLSERLKMRAVVVTGEELRKMSEKGLEAKIKRYSEITFARTSPQQKLTIVETCQRLGYVVAVTGDGVNDSPALKKADIGIAMGITGSEVSKQAADMILLNDDFSSIVRGVEEGRRIFENLKKTIAYTLTSNTPEMVPYVLYAVLGIPLPLTILLVIVINVVTDIMPALSLAFEASEDDIMNLPPRKPGDHLVTFELLYMAYFLVGSIQAAAGMYSYYVVMALNGFYPKRLVGIRGEWDSKTSLVSNSFGKSYTYAERFVIEQKAQTAYFAAIVITQISDVIICKTRRISLWQKGMTNHLLTISIFVSLACLFLVMEVPFFNKFLGTQPLEWYCVLMSVPFAILMILLDELRRLLIRRNCCRYIEKLTYY